jgi:hypothetical protein
VPDEHQSMIDGIKGTGKPPGRITSCPAAGGEAAPSSLGPLRALDIAGVAMLWTFRNMDLDILSLASNDTLVTLDAIEGFDGLFGWHSPNRSRPRIWMPRFLPLSLEPDKAGQS